MKLPRLYPILDTNTLALLSCSPETAAEAMLAGGARILQFRHKGHYSREIFAAAERVAAACARYGALLIIDDRADIANLLHAGVHVGQDDLSPQQARRLVGHSTIVGLSTHNADQLELAAAEPVDYLALGPIFATTTKKKPAPVLGIAQLQRARSLTTKPLVAIGGITRRNAIQVLEAGADSVAIISDMLPAVASYESIRDRMREWQLLLKS